MCVTDAVLVGNVRNCLRVQADVKTGKWAHLRTGVLTEGDREGPPKPPEELRHGRAKGKPFVPKHAHVRREAAPQARTVSVDVHG